MDGQIDIEAVLSKIDTATNHIAANLQVTADLDQKISDEIDAFLKANPPGTVLTGAQATQLQGFADKLQTASDSQDTQVEVLKAIASKGASNPVPVTPVPVSVPPSA